MRKRFDFNSEHGWGWPPVEKMEPYFLQPPGKRWFFETENDSGGLVIEGLNDTDNLPPFAGRIDIRLDMRAHPDLGVFLLYWKIDGKNSFACSSKGDLTKMRKWIKDMHGSLMPIGLYIPYSDAWRAVKEFMETGGELPKSIEWISNKELPPNTFPEPIPSRLKS